MFDAEYFNLGYLDTLSYRDTVIHRLDPRAKLLATLAFIVTVVSFPKHEISGLIPFLLYPVVFFSLADIPARFILKKVVVVSVFAVFVGIFNPLFDRQALYSVFGITVTSGWVSFGSIMFKFFLTVTAGLLLVATTSFPGICYALQRLGLPAIFTSQLLFLYRYLFVLLDETMTVVRARELRSFSRRRPDMRVFVSIVGTLFLRTIERAERIYRAMLSRGFSGALQTARPIRFRSADALFLGLMLLFLVVCRMYDIAGLAGALPRKVF